MAVDIEKTSSNSGRDDVKVGAVSDTEQSAAVHSGDGEDGDGEGKITFKTKLAILVS